jgi:hypothetical protein
MLNLVLFVAFVGDTQLCGEEHTKDLLEKLAKGGSYAEVLKRGSPKSPVQRPWMTPMRRLGIARADVELEFVWNGRLEKIRIREITYYRSYDSQPPISSWTTLRTIKLSGLDDMIRNQSWSNRAEEFARKQPETVPLGTSWRVTLTETLLDDPCLPDIQNVMPLLAYAKGSKEK